MEKKTWTQLKSDLNATFRKWHLDPPTIENSLPPRSKSKRVQTLEERTVSVRFYWRGKQVHLSVRRGESAVENLEAITKALETIRLTESRKLTDHVVALYRQLYPPAQHQQQSAPPPPPKQATIPEHYRLLHCAPDAPLAVCEAAYRALARTAHPDAGGDTGIMQRLNAAIEIIRKEKSPAG